MGWKDYGLVPRAVEMGISIHMGKYFGLAGSVSDGGCFGACAAADGAFARRCVALDYVVLSRIPAVRQFFS